MSATRSRRPSCLAVLVMAALATAVGGVRAAPDAVAVSPPAGPPDPALMALPSLFVDEVATFSADLCARRIPSSAGRWQEATQAWRDTHREQLARLERDRAALEAALRAHALAAGGPFDIGTYVGARGQAVSIVLYGLASADDAHAPAMCDQLRGMLADPARAAATFQQADAAARAALEVLGVHAP